LNARLSVDKTSPAMKLLTTRGASTCASWASISNARTADSSELRERWEEKREGERRASDGASGSTDGVDQGSPHAGLFSGRTLTLSQASKM
jgi:hypothetical protein